MTQANDVFAYSIEDAQRVSGIGRTMLYTLIGQGKLEARKIGRRTVIISTSLHSFLDSLPRAKITGGKNKAAASDNPP